MKTDTHNIECKKVAVCLLSYNSLHYLKKFVPSVLNTNYSDFTLVYIDNASTDDSVEYIQTNFPEVEIFRIYENHGFTGGYTGSLNYIKAEYYVLLNSDVEVTPNWLNPIMELLEKDSNTAAVQPKILHEPNKVQFDYAGASGGYMDKFGYTFCRGRIFNTVENDNNQYNSVEEIFWASGACLVVRSDVYHNLGGLDKNFYAHMEEIDLCWRIKNAGYSIKVVPQSIVYHVGGSIIKYGSFSKLFHNYRNSLVMLYKNLPKNKLFKILFIRLILDGVAAIRALISFQFTEFRAVFMAHMNFYRNINTWKKSRESAIKTVKNSNFGAVYNKSIVIEYFINNNKYFSKLNNNNFIS